MTAWFSIVLDGGAGGEMMNAPWGGGAGGKVPGGGSGRGVVMLGLVGPIGLSGQVVQYLTLLHFFSHKGWKGFSIKRRINIVLQIKLFRPHQCCLYWQSLPVAESSLLSVTQITHHQKDNQFINDFLFLFCLPCKHPLVYWHRQSCKWPIYTVSQVSSSY